MSDSPVLTREAALRVLTGPGQAYELQDVQIGGRNLRVFKNAPQSLRALFEAAGCQRFGYQREGVSRGMNYYSAPEEAMDSPQQMAPWARLSLEAALNAKSTGKVIVKVAVKKSQNPVKQPE